MARKKGSTQDEVDIDVMTDSWSGSANEGFNWDNGTSAPVTLSQYGSTTWPFINRPGSIGTGTTPDGLIGTAGTYYYNVNPSLSAGNPKTVVIG